jgi:hypothetical protein
VPRLIRTLWNDHLIGTPLERALLVRRRSPDWLRAGVVFIHVPKAAGTSISEALYGRFLGHVRAADVKRWASPAVRSLPFVGVTRNPWDRLVSAYRFVRRGGGVGGANAGGVWRPEQYQIPQFETFERFITEWLSRRDPKKLDYVFQPQSQFLCDDKGGIIVDHLGRFEDLESTSDYLRQALPTLSPISQSNRSGAPVDYRGFYTPKLADLAGSIYREDVARFGYSFE